MGLAIKNNNPGNLRDVSTGSFRSFNTPQDGYAALLNDLDAKRSGNTSTGLTGTSTLADFAAKYAPAGDNNDPAQYAANLANYMGVAPNAQLKDLDLNKWAQAVTHAEDQQNAANLGFTGGSSQVAAAGAAPLTPPNQVSGSMAYGNSPLQPPQEPANPFGVNSAYASDGSQHSGGIGGVVGGVGNFVKGLVSAPATIVARPFQLAAELAGVSPETVDKYNFGGLIAPTPKNANDVFQDVGRGLETISYGVGGGAAVKGLEGVAKGSLIQATKDAALQGAKAGAVAGLGSSLEENGSNATFEDMAGRTLTGAGIGGVTGGLIPTGGAIIKNVVPGLARGAAGLAGRAVQGAENATARAAAVNAAPKAEANAMRSGIQDEVINFVKSANQPTKNSFEKMLDVHKAAVSNPHPGAPQAKSIPGQTFLKAVSAVQSGSAKAAAKLKSIAASKGGKVNIAPALKDYMDSLASKGVTVSKGGVFKSTGKIPNSELKFYKDISKEIQSVLGRRKDNLNLSANQVHQLRQRLFATLDSATRQGGKVGERPFSNDVDADVQVLRRGLAKLLGPDYQKAAESYAKNESVLRNVAKMAGTTIDQLSTKDRKLGEVLMRSLGNASDRPLALIQDTLDAAKRNGFKSDEDILAQLRFADILENAYGSTQTRSLGGQVARGVTDSAMDLAHDAASGNLLSLGAKTVRALAGKSTDEQVKAFEAFIREQAKRAGKGLVKVPVKGK